MLRSCVPVACAACCLFCAPAESTDPWADAVVAYSAGVDGNPAYADATTALGAPERFTGEGIFPGVVSPFNPAFGTDELVAIGRGGSLVAITTAPIGIGLSRRIGWA